MPTSRARSASTWLAKTATGTCLGNDQLISIENATGTTGNDILRGDGVANVLRGGDGTDTLQGDGGNDTLIGGNGSADSVSDARGVTAGGTYSGVDINLALTTQQNTDGAGLDTIQTVEGVVGSALNDRILGSSVANTLKGSGGDDEIIGGAGADVINGLAGNDTINGGSGGDTIDGGLGTDLVHGDDGIDILTGGGGNNDAVWGDANVEGAARISGGNGTGDKCGEGSTAVEGYVAGDGCENP